LYGSAALAERLGNCSRVILESAGDLRWVELKDMTKPVSFEVEKRRGNPPVRV
jgi:hypothetical protein